MVVPLSAVLFFGMDNHCILFNLEYDQLHASGFWNVCLFVCPLVGGVAQRLDLRGVPEVEGQGGQHPPLNMVDPDALANLELVERVSVV